MRYYKLDFRWVFHICPKNENLLEYFFIYSWNNRSRYMSYWALTLCASNKSLTWQNIYRLYSPETSVQKGTFKDLITGPWIYSPVTQGCWRVTLQCPQLDPIMNTYIPGASLYANHVFNATFNVHVERISCTNRMVFRTILTHKCTNIIVLGQGQLCGSD